MITNDTSWSLWFSRRSFAKAEATPNKSLERAPQPVRVSGNIEPSIPIHLPGDPFASHQHTYRVLEFPRGRRVRRPLSFRIRSVPSNRLPSHVAQISQSASPLLVTFHDRCSWASPAEAKTHSVYKKTHSPFRVTSPLIP
jgi:hypothetical protein